jgi:hypothetical protein
MTDKGTSVARHQDVGYLMEMSSRCSSAHRELLERNIRL